MAAGVKVHSAVGKAGGILDGHRRDDPLGARSSLVAEELDGEQLLKCLDSIEKAVEVGCFHRHALLVADKFVGLGSEALLQNEAETFAVRFVVNLEILLGNLPELGGELLNGLGEAAVGVYPRLDIDFVVVKSVNAGACFDGCGLGNDADFNLFGAGNKRRSKGKEN